MDSKKVPIEYFLLITSPTNRLRYLKKTSKIFKKLLTQKFEVPAWNSIDLEFSKKARSLSIEGSTVALSDYETSTVIKLEGNKIKDKLTLPYPSGTLLQWKDFIILIGARTGVKLFQNNTEKYSSEQAFEISAHSDILPAISGSFIFFIDNSHKLMKFDLQRLVNSNFKDNIDNSTFVMVDDNVKRCGASKKYPGSIFYFKEGRYRPAEVYKDGKEIGKTKLKVPHYCALECIDRYVLVGGYYRTGGEVYPRSSHLELLTTAGKFLHGTTYAQTTILTYPARLKPFKVGLLPMVCVIRCSGFLDFLAILNKKLHYLGTNNIEKSEENIDNLGVDVLQFKSNSGSLLSLSSKGLLSLSWKL